ncbi:3-oxoacyl-ACP synthase [Flagellimonas algicola]|uniref:3-oxoacyl-ACP synthase n=1 Tax=Flagellimonas algicola TaxID=2583815 RepID=A0ABY2WKY1_9FLAO|nr:3-oxoacyl-ACP synthase [Allomuricauda algicola]TMU55192.1 3-oxoacyl-ACP synthase [Allomuricauda algicola]
MEIKEALLQFCQDYVRDKKEVLKKRSASLQESLNSETKSSAGDKHETGRAMVQLEQEKLGQQLQEIEKMAQVLNLVDLTSSTHKIGLGNLVQTSTAHYFIAISAGAFKPKNGNPIFCISPSTPIAKLLLGKEAGDTFIFNGKNHKILELT